MKAIPFKLLPPSLLLATALAWWAVIASAAPALDGPVTLTASASPSEITIGDPVTLVLTVTHPEGVTVDLPKTYQDISPFEILSVTPFETTHKNGQVVVRAEYKVTTFSVGSFTIPPLTAVYTDASGTQGEVRSPGLPVLVSSVLESGSEDGVKDIKPPVSIPAGPFPYKELGTALLAVATSVLAIVSLVRRLRQERPQRAPVSVEVSPEEWARRELERIFAPNRHAVGGYVEYYSAIARCIRQYLASKYGSWTLGCTTRELSEEMQRRGVDPWQARVVRGLLDECDSVRWARYWPAEARAERALTLAFEITGGG